MEQKLNEQESLKLITEMIVQARSNFRKGAGNAMIFWGYTITILGLINYILLAVCNGNTQAYWVWAITIPVFIVHTIIEQRKSKKDLVITHIDKVIGHVWIGFFVSAMVTILCIFGLAFGLKNSLFFLLINTAIMVLCGLSIYITGKLCRFKPYIYGAIFFWVGAVCSTVLPAVFGSQEVQFLVLAVCMTGGFVIPGHILNHKAKEDV